VDKDQWWAQLKRLTDKYGQHSAPAISAILNVGFGSETVMNHTVCEMVTALSTLDGELQSAKIKSAYISLGDDQELLPYVVSLLAVSCEKVIFHLSEMYGLGVTDAALMNLARKKLNESTDPNIKKAVAYLDKIGRRLKLKISDATEPEDRAYAVKETADEEQAILQGPRSPKVEQMIAAQKEKSTQEPAQEMSDGESQSSYAEPGDIVGGQDWNLVDLLGRGGMGSVWKARNHFNELGALKLMLPHLVSNDRLIQRFQLEIRAIKKIRHANIVELVDWGKDRLNGRDRWYFVTDFIRGKPLSRVLQERKDLGLEELKDMFIQIASGLHAAHAEGVIHRDIKPGNIMIRSDGSPVIIDFGIARQLENPSMTQTHERVLTLQFASPEQLYGEPVGPPSDVFSLAATLGFCFSPDPKRQRPQFEPDKVPEAFHYVLEKSLSYKQEHRPQDMEEFADLLSQIEFNNGVVVNFPRGDQLQGQALGSTPGLSDVNAFVPGQSKVKPTHALRLKAGPNDLSPELTAIRDEVFHYHGPDGQQKLPLYQIVELIKATPRGRHLVWKKGWSEWRPWFKLKLLKDYVQALKESQTSQAESGSLAPFSKHTIEIAGVSHNFIALPPGSFWMGNQNVDAEADEKPRHRVTLTQGLIVGETQVTQDLFESISGHNPSQYKQLKHPVERISWLDAVRWCNQLSEHQGLKPAYSIMNGGSTEVPRILWNRMNDGYRLPTESEWEYAARSGTNFTYSGSNRPDEVAWFGSSRRREGQRTYQVKGKSPNGWGLYDMSGNVWEWCWGDMREYNAEDKIDPIGANDTGYSICRGGSNYLDARQTRCSYRMRYAISYRSLFVGFRVVRSIGV
jgi:formylglycine-generating enzyme